MQASQSPRKLMRSRFALAAALALLPACALAQSRQTASRASGVDVFGTFSDTDTAFYGTDRHYGVNVGVDYTQFRYIPRFHALLTPSIEARGTYVSGNSVSEKTIQGGLKLAFNYHRLHPYAGLRVGGGSITFTPPAPLEPGFVYSSDSSFLFVYGGGLTYDILPRWSLIGDYEHQSWNLGFTPEIKFYPQSVSVGVVYHLRLKPFR